MKFGGLNPHSEKAMAPHPSTLAWKIPWSLVGCSPWGCTESDTTERLHFHFSLSCIGEGNGNPLQCSCLKNPRDGEPGGLPSMGSHRVGHDGSDLAAAAAADPHSAMMSSRICKYRALRSRIVHDPRASFLNTF